MEDIYSNEKSSSSDMIELASLRLLDEIDQKRESLWQKIGEQPFDLSTCQQQTMQAKTSRYSTTCSNPGLLVFESLAPRGSQKLTCPNQSA
jgi:hypothetical protein